MEKIKFSTSQKLIDDFLDVNVSRASSGLYKLLKHHIMPEDIILVVFQSVVDDLYTNYAHHRRGFIFSSGIQFPLTDGSENIEVIAGEIGL